MLFYGSVTELLDLLAGRADHDLDRAALLLARIEYPDLEIEPHLGLLDSYATELSGRLRAGSSGLDYVLTANRYLFEELGFAGNSENYYDPRNSCLNDVLISRLGIPITLSVLYMEVARRLKKPVFGIGLPGHFLVQYNDGLFSTFIDPFHRGPLLTAADCFQLVKRASGMEPPADPRLLFPVNKQQILTRMIANLRGIYVSAGAWPKTLRLLNLVLEANPGLAPEYRERALVHLRLSNANAARTDLERYLELTPDASDREQLEEQLAALRHYLARLN